MSFERRRDLLQPLFRRPVRRIGEEPQPQSPDPEPGHGAHDRLGVRRLHRRDVGGDEVDVAPAAAQGLGELRQCLRRALRLDLPPDAHGAFDAVPPDRGDQLGGLLRVELLERLREADEREAARLAALGRIRVRADPGRRPPWRRLPSPGGRAATSSMGRAGRWSMAFVGLVGVRDPRRTTSWPGSRAGWGNRSTSPARADEMSESSVWTTRAGSPGSCHIKAPRAMPRFAAASRSPLCQGTCRGVSLHLGWWRRQASPGRSTRNVTSRVCSTSVT